MFKEQIKDKYKRDIKEVKKITLPGKNETKIILKNRNFSGYEAVLNISLNEKIKSIIILTYWISVEAFKKTELICKNIKLIAANNLFLASRNKKTFYNDKNIKLTDIHAKLQLIETENNKYIVSSSANFGTIDNLDFVIIQNNNNLYNEICREVIKI